MAFCIITKHGKIKTHSLECMKIFRFIVRVKIFIENRFKLKKKLSYLSFYSNLLKEEKYLDYYPI